MRLTSGSRTEMPSSVISCRGAAAPLKLFTCKLKCRTMQYSVFHPGAVRLERTLLYVQGVCCTLAHWTLCYDLHG